MTIGARKKNNTSEYPEDKVEYPFAPKDPIPPNMPMACEDRMTPVALKPAASFIERAVLSAHRKFRLSVKFWLALVVATPPVLYALADIFTILASELEIEILSNGVIPGLFALVITISALIVMTMSATHLVEQRFTLIRRQFDFGAEAINVDDESHIENAIITLQKTFAYRIILLRWLRDLRDVVVAAPVFGTLVLLLAVAYFPQILATISPDDRFAWATVFGADFLFAVYFANRLIHAAGDSKPLNPIAPIVGRLGKLLSEVQSLRRGVRV